LIDMDRRKDHSAIKHFDPNTQSPPAAVLVSPDGQTLPIPVSKPGEPFEKSFRAVLDKVLFSPQRSEILKEVSKAYGVIMLIEGPDAKENAEARKNASAAVEAVASQMEFMPKEIATPPKLVVMDTKAAADEGVLLWSLGLEPKDVNEPLAIVLYGRARWIGPLFRGEQINEDDLASVLFVVGADCECGLDFRWIQGTMPAKWDQETHERAVESLGFDPESPMIKMEIGSIVSRGMGRYGYQSMPLGYRELIIEPETDLEDLPAENVSEPEIVPATTGVEANDVASSPEPNEPNDFTPVGKRDGAPPVQAVGPVAAEPNQAAPQEQTTGQGTLYGSVRIAAFLTIGLFALVIILGIAILARGRRV